MKTQQAGTIYLEKPLLPTGEDVIGKFKVLTKDKEQEILHSKGILVQKYLNTGLLLDGLKFDLRVYIVIIGLNPIQAYLCDEGQARYCMKEY